MAASNRKGSGSVSGLTATQLLFGGSTGLIQQSADLTWNDTTKVLTAAGTSAKIDVNGTSSSSLRNRLSDTTVYQVTNSGTNLQLMEFQGELRIRDLDTESTLISVLETGLVGVGAAPIASTKFSVTDAGTANDCLRLRATSASGSAVAASHNSGGRSMQWHIDGASVAGTLFGFTRADAVFIRASGGATGIVMGTDGAFPLVLGTNNAERMRISSAGDVGIGVAPVSSIILKVGSRADEYIRVATDSTEWDFGVGAFGAGDDLLYIGNGGTAAIVAEKAGGDVIISGPSASLTAPGVVATTATKGFLRITTCAGVPTGAATTGALVLDSTNNKVYVRSSGAWVALN